MKDSVYGKGIVLMIIAVFIGAFIETSVSTENIGRGEIIRDFVSTEIDGVCEGIATTF